MWITNYRELQSKDGLLPLFVQAFYFRPFSPEEREEIFRADSRLQHSPVGFVAIENGCLAGFVGVMDIATRTLDGAEETVGGIWGVVTHPAYARRGISAALMQRSHEYFKEKRYRFSLLNTFKPFVAYEFFQKLGYKEAVIFPSAHKLIKGPRKKAELTRKIRLDWNKILKIYNKATKDRTGLVIRNREYGKMLETRRSPSKIQPEKSIITDEGYALLNEDEGHVTVQEIIGLTKQEISKLIIRIEEKATKTVIDRIVLDDNVQKAYQSHGYIMLKDSYDVLMAKPLERISFKEVYGDKFYMTSADLY